MGARNCYKVSKEVINRKKRRELFESAITFIGFIILFFLMILFPFFFI